MGEAKVYVGGLNFDTSRESLDLHFTQYGKVIDSIVMMDKATNRSRGFGFVTFDTVEEANKALGSTSNMLDGRDISCKKALKEGDIDKREDAKQAGGGDDGASYNVVKVFVGGLPASCDHDRLIGYFKQFGDIKDAVVMMDNATQRHRGFGYVTFHESSSVEAAIKNHTDNKIDGKWVEVKRCIPQEHMGGGGGGGGGGGKGRRGKRDNSPPRSSSTAAPPPPGAYGAYAAAGYYGAYGAPPAYGYYGMYPGMSPGMPPAYGAHAAYGAPPPGYPAYPGYPPAHGAPPGYDPYAAYAAAAGYGAYGAAAPARPIEGQRPGPY